MACVALVQVSILIVMGLQCRGANSAMRDGANLGRALETAARGQISLSRALAEYEAEMASYGFDLVRKSAAMGERLMGQNPLHAVL